MHQMFIFTGLFGVGLFIAGCVINYRIGRRRFSRRSITGMEVFRSYEHAWGTRLLERVGRLIAFLLIIAGLMIVLGSIFGVTFLK